MLIDEEYALVNNLLPVEVFDANGVVIKRRITWFDTETGEVESYILDKHGKHILKIEKDEFKRRVEKYPAPLTYKAKFFDHFKDEELLDLQEDNQ